MSVGEVASGSETSFRDRNPNIMTSLSRVGDDRVAQSAYHSENNIQSDNDNHDDQPGTHVLDLQ